MEYNKQFIEEVKQCINTIEQDYTKAQIKCFWKKNSLAYDMGVIGHSVEEVGDWYDAMYRAGQIVLIKNYVFNVHDNFKLETYKLMCDLRIPFDRKMSHDYDRLKRRENFFKHNYYKYNKNIESTLWSDINYIWNFHKPLLFIIVTNLVVSLLLFRRVFNNETDKTN